MYCAKCGVNLADTEHSCPLCGFPAHPDLKREAEPLYPPKKDPVRVNSKAVHGVALFFYLLPILVCLQCDLLMTGSVTWSGYVLGALLVFYVTVSLPMWFHRPNPVIFVPCSFAAAAVFLWYIDWSVRGGWFWGFALPVTAVFALVVTAMVALLRYVPKGALYTIGGGLLTLGAFMPVMGWLVNETFFTGGFAIWSVYPTTSLVLVGGLLIFLAICAPARRVLQRKLFI